MDVIGGNDTSDNHGVMTPVMAQESAVAPERAQPG
jgi:hypothetical protein